MPIYEYSCGKCGKVTDVLQKVDDPGPKKCAACGAKGKMTRVVSRTSFVLKGGGWYSDLYGSKKKDTSSTSTPGSSGSSSEAKASPSTSAASTAPASSSATAGGSAGKAPAAKK